MKRVLIAIIFLYSNNCIAQTASAEKNYDNLACTSKLSETLQSELALRSQVFRLNSEIEKLKTNMQNSKKDDK